MDAVVVVEVGAAVVIGVAGFFGAALYARLTGLLDDTAKALNDVAKITATHGVRLDALERKQ